MRGDTVGLARHEVEIRPQFAERAVRHDGTDTAYLGFVEFDAERETLVHHGHRSHKVAVLQIVEFLSGVGHIDHVEGVLQVITHPSVDGKRILVVAQETSARHVLLIKVGAQRGNAIDGAFGIRADIVCLPHDGVNVAQLGVIQVLRSQIPHLLPALRAKRQRCAALSVG